MLTRSRAVRTAVGDGGRACAAWPRRRRRRVEQVDPAAPGVRPPPLLRYVGERVGAEQGALGGGGQVEPASEACHDSVVTAWSVPASARAAAPGGPAHLLGASAPSSPAGAEPDGDEQRRGDRAAGGELDDLVGLAGRARPRRAAPRARRRTPRRQLAAPGASRGAAVSVPCSRRRARQDADHHRVARRPSRRSCRRRSAGAARSRRAPRRVGRTGSRARRPGGETASRC